MNLGASFSRARNPRLFHTLEAADSSPASACAPLVSLRPHRRLKKKTGGLGKKIGGTKKKGLGGATKVGTGVDMDALEKKANAADDERAKAPAEEQLGNLGGGSSGSASGRLKMKGTEKKRDL